MERITLSKRRLRRGLGRLGGERIPLAVPEGAIFLNDGFGGSIVDTCKKSAAKDLDRLVVLGRVQQGRFARRYALCLDHAVGDELVLVAVGVTRLAIFSDGQRVHECSPRRGFNGLEEPRQKRG
jgi:hypothetical protein